MQYEKAILEAEFWNSNSSVPVKATLFFTSIPSYFFCDQIFKLGCVHKNYRYRPNNRNCKERNRNML